MPAASNKKIHKARRYLGDNYEPHVNDVLIGRGRRVEQHNKKFRAMINAHLAAYYNAQTKATKSTIILRIFQQVMRGGGTGFVKQEASSRRWFAIEDSSARISIAQAFRDALSSQYKSSKQYKQQKRKEEHGNPLLQTMGLGEESTPFITQSYQKSAAPQGSALTSLLPPRLIPMVSSDGQDLSRTSLPSIFCGASNIVPSIRTEAFLRSPEAVTSSSNPRTENSNNIFCCLEKALDSQLDLSSNPFEPTPILEDDLLLGDGDADLMDSIRDTFSL